MPKSAEPLLPLCWKHEEPWDNACFDTYAELFVFAAGYGYQSLTGRKPSEPRDFLKNPNPIDLAVFKNQQLFPCLLLLALASDGDAQIARDDDSLCRLVEGYADRGFKTLLKEASIQARTHLNLAQVLGTSVYTFQTETI